MTETRRKAFDATARIFKAHAPAARIERLRAQEAKLVKDKSLSRWLAPSWRPMADELARWYEEAGQHAPPALIDAIGEAEKDVAMPRANRDNARQAGTRKGRGSRAPMLDAWLDKQDLSLSDDRLWSLLPESASNEFARIYRDGDEVFEDGRQRSITRRAFNNRVRTARKRQTR